MMLGFTTESIYQLLLPSSIDQSSTLHIIVQIRDTFGCVTEFHVPSVIVLPDYLAISKFIDALQEPNNNSNGDSIVQLLGNSDQNTVGQIVTSISQVFDEMNNEMIQTVAWSKYLLKKKVEMFQCFFSRWNFYD
jgi:hypothetical protein